MGRKTAISTSVMPMTGPITSPIALIVAFFGVEPAVVDVVDGVLDDHDRVVDHDADGQHQAEQREHVDREAQRPHRGEGADDRHGHGRRGDQHRTPVLEEDQDHDQDEDAGLEQGLVDLVDRLLDEHRRVERDRVFEAFGEGWLRARSIAAWTFLATSSALAPGSWKTPMPAAGLPPISHHWS